jgi:hypothetical protein
VAVETEFNEEQQHQLMVQLIVAVVVALLKMDLATQLVQVVPVL